jgi:hypothetical protein
MDGTLTRQTSYGRETLPLARSIYHNNFNLRCHFSAPTAVPNSSSANA